MDHNKSLKPSSKIFCVNTHPRGELTHWNENAVLQLAF